MDPACVQEALYRPDSLRESGLYIAPRNTRDTQGLSDGLARWMVWDGLAEAWLDHGCVQQWLNRPDSPRESGLYIAPRNTRDTQAHPARPSGWMVWDGLAGWHGWAMVDPACVQGALYRPDSPRESGLYIALWIYRDTHSQPARPSGWMVWLAGWIMAGGQRCCSP